MIYFAFLLAEVIILFFLSRLVSKTFSGFMSINWLSFIFLPGVIIHELSHLFVAAILFVPVGEMEFVPRKHGDSVKLGSVEIGKTDPIRRSLIGFAPFFVGLAIIVSGVYLFNQNISFFQNLNPYAFVLSILVFAYLMFAIGNTMFASKRDLEGSLEILIAILIILAAGYLLGFRLPIGFLEKLITKDLLIVIQKSVMFLLVPICIDLLILGAVRLFTGSRNRI